MMKYDDRVGATIAIVVGVIALLHGLTPAGRSILEEGFFRRNEQLRLNADIDRSVRWAVRICVIIGGALIFVGVARWLGFLAT
jgi:hypothetical protein